MNEHPTDFGSKPATDELIKLITWMKTKPHFIYYVSVLAPLGRACAQLDQDPDCMYAKKDPLARPWQEVDDELSAREQEHDRKQPNRDEDSDATETESLYKSPLKGKGKERASFLPGASRGDRRRMGEAARQAGSGSARGRWAAPDQRYEQQQTPSNARDRRHTVVALSPIGPVRDDAVADDTEEKASRLRAKSETDAAAEEYRAAKRLKASRYFIKLIRQPILDAVRLRTPKVFDYTPMVIGEETTRRDIVEHVQKAADILLMMEPRHIAEEMTNIMKPSFLNIQVRFDTFFAFPQHIAHCPTTCRAAIGFVIPINLRLELSTTRKATFHRGYPDGYRRTMTLMKLTTSSIVGWFGMCLCISRISV
jgi:hypothetical protein